MCRSAFVLGRFRQTKCEWNGDEQWDSCCCYWCWPCNALQWWTTKALPKANESDEPIISEHSTHPCAPEMWARASLCHVHTLTCGSHTNGLGKNRTHGKSTYIKFSARGGWIVPLRCYWQKPTHKQQKRVIPRITLKRWEYLWWTRLVMWCTTISYCTLHFGHVDLCS